MLVNCVLPLLVAGPSAAGAVLMISEGCRCQAGTNKPAKEGNSAYLVVEIVHRWSAGLFVDVATCEATILNRMLQMNCNVDLHHVSRLCVEANLT